MAGLVIAVIGAVVYLTTSFYVIPSTVKFSNLRETTLNPGGLLSLQLNGSSVLFYNDSSGNSSSIPLKPISTSKVIQNQSKGVFSLVLVNVTSPTQVDLKDNYSAPVNVSYVVASGDIAFAFTASLFYVIGFLMILAGGAMAVLGYFLGRKEKESK